MGTFPRLSTGSGGQLPLRRARRINTVSTRNDSGYLFASDGEGNGWVEWDCEYRDVTRDEALLLQQFFEDHSGTLERFTFCDPMANLLRWSGDLSKPIWVKSAGSSVAALGDGVFSVQGVGGISQTVAVPGSEPLLFSLEARTPGNATVRLERGTLATETPIGPSWTECLLLGEGSGSSSTFSIKPSSGVEVRRIQVRTATQVPSYVESDGRSGVFEETFFLSQEVEVTRTGWDRFDVRLQLESRW